MSEPIPSVPIVSRPGQFALDATGRLDEDVICRKCGYNLRGLSSQGVCSECGTAVGRSMMGDLLRFSDPKWVRSLASGMDWILVGFIIAVATSCLLGALFKAAFGRPTGWMALWQMLVGLIPMVGYWKLTNPDPGGLEDSKLNKSRKLVRITTIINYLASPAQVALSLVGPIIGGILSFALGINSLISVIALYIFARLMALRIPDEKLARSCRTVMWMSVILIVLLMCMFVGLALLGPAMVPGSPGAVTSAPSAGAVPATPMSFGGAGAPGIGWIGISVGGCAVALLGLVVLIWGIILFFRFRSAFHEAARLALHSWAAPTLPAPPPNA